MSFHKSFSNVMETCAKLTGFSFWVPAKITSCILFPRRFFADCSPKTHKIASEIFDFPLPLGPTIAVMGLSKFNFILSLKDLKPCISTDFNPTATPLFQYI